MMADMWRGDRTIEVCTYGRAEYTIEFVLDLQETLVGKLRLWRIQLQAPTRDDAILIYPECVRNNDAVSGEPLTETLKRVNSHIQAWERRYLRYCCQPMPGYRQPAIPPRLIEARVVYNSDDSDAHRNWPLFRSVPDTDEPSTEEYLEFEKVLCRVLARYGPIVTDNEVSDRTKERLGALWLVRTTAMQWDRTRILVRYGSAGFTGQLIDDIQQVLRVWPLWRVALDADDDRQVRFVYPSLIR
jgi:hypothetical protein